MIKPVKAKLLLVAFTLLYNSAYSIPPIGQVVNYSDFSYVRDVATSSGRVFFATTNGIIVYDRFTRSWNDPLTGKPGLEDDDIYAIWVDRFGSNLYAQSTIQYFEYDSAFQEWYSIPSLPDVETEDREIAPPKVMFAPPGFNYMNDGRLVDKFGRYYAFNELIDDGTGELWAGTWGHGPARASGSSGTIELLPYGLLQERVNTIYNDFGYLWISGAVTNSERTGISIFDPEVNSFEYIESGLMRDFPSVDINCITGNDKNIYVGTDIGVIILDRESFQVVDRISRRDGLYNENVLSLAVRGDSIFAGTEEGLDLVYRENDSIRVTGPVSLLDDVIFDLELVDSTLWIAATSGAYRWQWQTDRLQQYQDPNLVIFSTCLSLDRWENNLWLASNDGLVKLDLETGETTPFRNVVSNRNYRALSVNDTIAVMTSNLGMTILFHANEKPYEREFTTDDGLPSSRVYELELDGDFVWIGSDKGLTRFWWNNPSRVD